MSKTATVAIIIVLIAIGIFAAYQLGAFGRDDAPQGIPNPAYEVPAEGQAPVSSDSELESIDLGADLESDFNSADADIQSL